MTSVRVATTLRRASDIIRKPGVWILSACLLSASAVEASTIVNVAGTTAGCFGTSCSTFSSSTTSIAAYNLTFTGTTFDVTTDAAGAATNFALGSLARGNTNTSSSTAALPFTLQVTFTLPTGITGGPASSFTALITGTNTGGGGGLSVDFDNTWLTFAYANSFGSGSFDFSVSDLSVNKNNSSSIFGSIRNASFTPTSVNPPPNNVPEPAMLLLFGTAALTLARQRRKTGR
jgi:hypothetical protein